MKKLFLAAFLTLLVVTTSNLSAYCGQRENILRWALRTPAKSIENYDFDPKSSIISRIKNAPGFMIAYLNAMDNVTCYTAYKPNSDELKLIGKYIDQLPNSFKTALRGHLLGIYFVNNFKGGGISDWVLGLDRERHYIMVLNVDTLRTTADKWLTHKDNSCFIQNDPSIRVEVDCGKGLPEFAEIIMHEAAHIADYVIGYTPYVEGQLKILDGARPDRIQFTEGIWKDYLQPKSKYDFRERENLYFYGISPAAINNKHAERVYRGLSKTPFVALYGSKNWADDFACLFTFYYITQILKRPYEYRVYKDNKLVFSWSPAESELVSRRFPLIREIFNTN